MISRPAKLYAVVGIAISMSVGISSRAGAQVLQSTSVGYWRSAAPMPCALFSMGVAAAGSSIYAIGGAGTCNNVSGDQDTNFAYNTVTNRWTTRAALPSAITADGSNNAAAVNGIIYVIGGAVSGSCVGTNQAYDTTSNSWAGELSAPTPVCGAAVVADGGVVYVIGGNNTGGSMVYDLVQIYDPTTNSWSSGASMPTPRVSSGAAVINGIIYVAGGGNASGNLTTLESYDPGTNSWAELTPMPTARGSMSIGAIGDLLYVIGGSSASGFLSSNEIYDPVAQTWSTGAPIRLGSTGSNAAVVNNSMYVLGGNFGGSNDLSANQVFSPNCDLLSLVPAPIYDLVCVP